MRRFGLALLFKVRGAPYNDLVEVRTYAHGDHVLRDLLAQANARIEAIGRDVREAIVVDDLDAYVWVVR
jgi:hypothetical protein